MVRTNRRKQMWADEDFVITLERVKAQTILNGQPVKSIPELTKEILSTNGFKEAVKEVLEGKKNLDIRIRFDKKKLW